VVIVFSIISVVLSFFVIAWQFWVSLLFVRNSPCTASHLQADTSRSTTPAWHHAISFWIRPGTTTSKWRLFHCGDAEKAHPVYPSIKPRLGGRKQISQPQTSPWRKSSTQCQTRY